MTNAALAKEVCRVIRGLHGNYPEGYALVCRQIEELEGMNTYAVMHDLLKRVEALEARANAPAKVEPIGIVPLAVDLPRREENAADSGEQDSAAPKGIGATQGEKRGPGRPRKVRVEE